MLAFSALLALAAPLLARADVTPSEPGPGAVYNAGGTCRVTWTGDSDSTTVWKGMAIELMTGANLNMAHLTTVATDQDGTTDGAFTYTCPDVTPNSAIYFYQFSSANTNVKTWTTRFTIASSTGQSTPPPNATQPGSNDPIPWGLGALNDPSKATPPPNFTAGGNGTTNTTTSVAAPTTQAGVVTSSTPTSSRLSTTVSTTSTSSSAAATTSTTNAAGLSTAFDVRVVMAAFGMMFTALVL